MNNKLIEKLEHTFNMVDAHFGADASAPVREAIAALSHSAAEPVVNVHAWLKEFSVKPSEIAATHEVCGCNFVADFNVVRLAAQYESMLKPVANDIILQKWQEENERSAGYFNVSARVFSAQDVQELLEGKQLVPVQSLSAPSQQLTSETPTSGNWIAADDVKRLVRELDVALNGEDGAAQQASLCDIVAQVKCGRWRLVPVSVDAPQVPAKEVPEGYVPVLKNDLSLLVYAPMGLVSYPDGCVRCESCSAKIPEDTVMDDGPFPHVVGCKHIAYEEARVRLSSALSTESMSSEGGREQ